VRARAPALTLLLISALAARPSSAAIERAEVSLDARLGLARSPFPSPEARTISGGLTSLLLEGRARVAPSLEVRIRMPLVLAGLDQPAGAIRGETAWGHPEAAVAWRLHDAAPALLLGQLALALPFDGGDAALGRRPLANQALLLASAQRGWHDQELYAPGRLALTPSARIELERGMVQGFGQLKAPFMLAVSRGDADPRTRIRSLALATVVGAGAAVSWRRLRAGVAPWLAADLLPASVLRERAPARWTVTVDPEVQLRIGAHVSATLAATIPIAGALDAVPALGLGVTGAW
jgi:hypothetical protein